MSIAITGETSPLESPSVNSQVPSVLFPLIVQDATKLSFSSCASQTFPFHPSPNESYKLKSITVSIFLLSIAIGNIYTSIINFHNERDDGSVILTGYNYFLFFTLIMLIATILFFPLA